MSGHRFVHGESKPRTPEYLAWRNMRARCTNPGHNSWARYGGREIRVCARWDAFTSFLADVGRSPGPEYSIDRIDNNGNYEPGNVRWATRAEQARNRFGNVLLIYDGRTQTLSAWEEEKGFPSGTLCQRLKRQKWSPMRCIETPVSSRRPQIRLPPETRTALIADYVEGGMSQEAIVAKYGASKSTVARLTLGIRPQRRSS